MLTDLCPSREGGGVTPLIFEANVPNGGLTPFASPIVHVAGRSFLDEFGFGRNRGANELPRIHAVCRRQALHSLQPNLLFTPGLQLLVELETEASGLGELLLGKIVPRA